jgi:hypothetical protein
VLNLITALEALRALVDGERDPARLAELAKGRLRAKLSALAEASTGVPPITTHR